MYSAHKAPWEGTSTYRYSANHTQRRTEQSSEGHGDLVCVPRAVCTGLLLMLQLPISLDYTGESLHILAYLYVTHKSALSLRAPVCPAKSAPTGRDQGEAAKG